MSLFQNLSIKSKIMSIVMLTSCIALLAACAAIITYEYFAFRSNLVLEMSTLADTTGKNCAVPLTFDQPADADPTLAHLPGEGQIRAACIYKEGKVWTKFPKSLPDSAFPPASEIPINGHRFAKESLHVAREIHDPKGELIGTM